MNRCGGSFISAQKEKSSSHCYSQNRMNANCYQACAAFFLLNKFSIIRITLPCRIRVRIRFV